MILIGMRWWVLFCLQDRAFAENFGPGPGLLTTSKKFPGEGGVGAWN